MAKLRAVECREFIQAVTEKATEMGVPVRWRSSVPRAT